MAIRKLAPEAVEERLRLGPWRPAVVASSARPLGLTITIATHEH